MTRAGLLVPSSNPTVEAFLPRVAGVLDVQFLVTRLGVRRIAADAEADAQFDRGGLQAAAALLTDAEVAMVSWAGTSGCWLGGDREDALLAAVSAAVGVRVTSSRVALLAALAEQPGAALGVLTPYVGAVHARVVGGLAAAGHPVAADRALGIERNLDFAAIPGAVVAGELRALGARGAATPVVVCTNVAGCLPELAGEGFVVVDSVLATLWHAARIAGATTASYAGCYRAVQERW